MKKKFSLALLKISVFLMLILCCYLGKEVLNTDDNNKCTKPFPKVSHLYQQYQKAHRLQSYLNDLEELNMLTEKLEQGADSLKNDFNSAQSAFKQSLNIDLKHEK